MIGSANANLWKKMMSNPPNLAAETARQGHPEQFFF
jgi:hypothetical protein